MTRTTLRRRVERLEIASGGESFSLFEMVKLSYIPREGRTPEEEAVYAEIKRRWERTQPGQKAKWTKLFGKHGEGNQNGRHRSPDTANAQSRNF